MRGSAVLDARRHRAALTVSLLLASTAISAPGLAWAQQAAGPAVVAPEAVSSEIVVTARRRSENLSRVPTAITAFSGEQLVERAIRTESDLQTATPGLTVRQTQGNNSLTYAIRGQSAETFSGSPSAVVAFLNEVPLNVSAATSFFDLETVQVLKGPQGTLFGRNATGGAVLYNSARPTESFDTSFRARIGNLDLRELEGMINLPIISDKLLLRGAFNVIDRDGYIEDLSNGDIKGAIRRQSGRVTLLVRPTDQIVNTTMFQYVHTAGTNTGASYTYNAYPCGATNNGVALNCAGAAVFPGLLDYVEEQRRLGPYKTRYLGGSEHRGNDWFLSNTTTVELGENLQFKNIFGISRSWSRSEQGGIGAPYPIFLSRNFDTGEFGNLQRANSISEELQLQGKSLGDNLTWIVGAYFQKLEVETRWPQHYFGVANLTSAYRNENKTEAVYAQGTYDLGDATKLEGLRFTAGLRYTWEHVKFRHIPGSTIWFGTPEQSRDFSDPSWEVGLEYQATPELLTYLKTRGSFRSGGFNGAAPAIDADATGGGNRFGSEHTQDVEAGLKFRGDVADRAATLNVAAFHQWVQDVQRVEFPALPGGSTAVTVNVPKARIYGVEVDTTFALAPWLQVGASGSYVKADFTEPDVVLFGVSYSYGPFPDTPEWSGAVWAEATLHDSEAVGRLSVRADVYAQTHTYFSSSASSLTPGTRLPGYTLVNARLGWDEIGGSRVSAALWGKNLTDEEYFTGGIPLGASLGTNNAAVGEPRTYGVEISARF